jgi:hypothetical protein
LSAVQVRGSDIHKEKTMSRLAVAFSLSIAFGAAVFIAFRAGSASAGTVPCPTPTMWELDDRLNDIERVLFDLHHPNAQAGELSPRLRLEVMERRRRERERLWLTCDEGESAL